MKTLTIISSIFMPLTFIVGVYGMNFRYMPELDLPYAYPVLLVIMLIIASSLWFYYKRKKWL
jgi:magnesium transporter